MSKYVKYMSILIMLMAFATVATAANPAISNPNPDPSSPVSGTEGGSQTFTFDINQSVNVTWYINETVVQDNEKGVTQASYQNNSAAIGYWNVSAVASNDNGTDMQTWWWNVTTVQAGSPAISNPNPDPSSPVSGTEGGSQTFTFDINQSVNVTWYINETVVQDNEKGVTQASYQNNSAAIGYWNVSAVASNDNGTDMQTWWWNVTTVQAGSPAISNPNPSSPVSGTEGGSQTFTFDINQSVNVTWYINETVVQDNEKGVTQASYQNNSAAIGYWNVSAVASNDNGTDMQTWWWTVAQPGFSTGNRIWEKDTCGDPYRWTAQSFTGFYYDIDTNESTETLTIKNIGQTIGAGDIEYVTKTRLVKFDCSKWGEYNVIGFMAEKYFAGYDKDETDEITDETISLVSNKMLSKVLIDNDDKRTVSTGASLELQEGYELKIIQLDASGDKAQIELLRNGKSVDTGIIDKTPATYVYTRDIGKADDVPLIAIFVDSVFSGTETDMLVIKGIFQISEDYKSVKNDDRYGEMEITHTSSTEIKMKNDDKISLDEGKIVPLMGNIKFRVADSTTLRFALYEEITEPGTHDIRGTVYNTTEWQTWTTMNFEGFYYDIDDDLGTETLKVEDTGTNIGSGKLVYTTEVQSVTFDYSGWGEYNVIGFMAEKYFAGYNTDTDDDITDDATSLVSDQMLSKVLIDNDDKRTVSTGASLELQEGYELKIIQLDASGDKAQIELLRNGKSVDTGIIDKTPATYVYTRDIGKADDVPLIAIFVDSVFSGTETDMLVIKGIFQISEDYKSVKNDDRYGEMEITYTSSSKIIMKNDDDIDLDEGGNTMITENIGFKTSEFGERYCLFVRRTIGSLPALKIDVSDSPIVDTEITITVTSGGSAVEGAEVTFDGTKLNGSTDSSGEIRFTSEEAGTFTITASKNNYDSASDEIRILTEDEAEKDPLEIAMLEKVDPGADVVIKVTSEGAVIEGASIIWGGEDIGETDETGSLTYTAEDAGTYTVTASKAGYLDASEEITVAFPSAEFELADLTFPAETSANKKFTITVDVTNAGDADGTYLAELVVDGTAAESTSVDLDAGETVTVEFTHKISKAGTYTIEIGSESGEIAVTKSGSNTALVAAALIVLAALGAIGYVLISSTPEGGWTVEKLIEAIKDKFRKDGKGL